MDALAWASGSALWLGVLTSISPCPLATNLVAVSYIGQRVAQPSAVVLAGLLYAMGRMVAYTALGAVLTASLLAVPQVSNALQTHVNKLLGPVLILAGMVVLDLLSLPLAGSRLGERMSNRAGTWGIWGAGVLGILFALSFCPVSAALFFGSLLPLAVKTGSRLLVPSLYGAGTAAPVVAVALLMAWGAQSLGRVLNRLAIFEKWARLATGAVFLVVGVYYSLAYIFEVFV
jgi:cytochrome c-type biogenesis protein